MTQEIIKVQNLTRSFRQYKKQPGFRGTIKSFFNRHYYDIEAVKSISFSIKDGEAVGFIGPNGAGKTTTLKMLSGVLHPTSGEVEVLGYKPFERKQDYQRLFALVMGQKSQLWWDLPPVETFLLNKEIYNVGDDDYKEFVNYLAEILEVQDVMNVPTRKLSLGQRMKCELLASLLHKPKLLFLDEPTIGLDVVVQKKIRKFLKEYNSQYKTTMILTSHYMEDVQELCDRIIIINKGEIIFDNSLEQLKLSFSPQKYLKLVFNKVVNKKDLEKYGAVLSRDDDGLSTTIAVDHKDHAQVASKILLDLPVDDLDIAEEKLEDIIAKIFEE